MRQPAYPERLADFLPHAGEASFPRRPAIWALKLPPDKRGGRLGTAKPVNLGARTLFTSETAHYRIKVEDDRAGRRHLVFDEGNGSQSIYNPDEPGELASQYMRHCFAGLAALPKDPGRVLFIGLGGGVMPSYFRRHFRDAEIDIVEVDEGLLEVARLYFGFQPDATMRVFFEDARGFVGKRRSRGYEVIFLDAYSGTQVPPHLTTREFFTELAATMAVDGLLCCNIANFDTPDFIRGELRTLAAAFPNLMVMVTPLLANYVALASASLNFDTDAMARRADALEVSRGLRVEQRQSLRRRMTPSELAAYTSIGGNTIFTDADISPQG